MFNCSFHHALIIPMIFLSRFPIFDDNPKSSPILGINPAMRRAFGISSEWWTRDEMNRINVVARRFNQPSSSPISPSSSSRSDTEIVRFSISIKLSFNLIDSAAAIAAASLARFSSICSGVSRRPELSMRNVSGHLPRTFRWRFRNNGKMLRPSMCCGVGTPPMSRNVGAKSIFNTISSTLCEHEEKKPQN